jgi:hypothetical protein
MVQIASLAALSARVTDAHALAWHGTAATQSWSFLQASVEKTGAATEVDDPDGLGGFLALDGASAARSARLKDARAASSKRARLFILGPI